MIVLRPHNLHWIDGTADNPADLCAHGGVEFRIDDDTLLQPSDGTCTVSAAAIYLLRTLSQPHTKTEPVAEFLFPCCGNGIFEVEGSDDVLIIGCNSGTNFDVVQAGEQAVLTAGNGTQYQVTVSDWAKAVCAFSDSVRSFYTASSPKSSEDAFEERSFLKFLSEWSRRRSMAQSQLRR